MLDFIWSTHEKMYLFDLFFTFMLLGCSNFNISKDSLVTQLRENQTKKESLTGIFLYTGPISALFLNATYNSNSIEKILCKNDKGEKVFLYPDKNVQLDITRKSNKLVEKIHFDTAFLVNDKIISLRSRLIKDWVIEVQLNDIEKISFDAEFAKTEKVE